MGLCKCPKKKVTNLFCFEHRVNVCEHCLVSNHPKCIVQSYLQWLQDSDYNPNCPLCNRLLADDECGDCARLLCYDVFHWACLNAYAQQLPANTAPAGYACPTCTSGMFPPTNQVSPVADSLRQLLTQVNWARAGLGLPLIEEAPKAPPAPVKIETTSSSTKTSHDTVSYGHTSLPSDTYTSHNSYDTRMNSVKNTNTPLSSKTKGHSVVNVDEGALYSRADGFSTANPRKLFDTRTDHGNTTFDHDEDKYKRRSPFTFLSKWFSSRSQPGRRGPTSTYKRFLMVLVIGLICFVTMIIFMNKMGRSATDDDPLLDPRFNPNIKVEDLKREDTLL